MRLVINVDAQCNIFRAIVSPNNNASPCGYYVPGWLGYNRSLRAAIAACMRIVDLRYRKRKFLTVNKIVADEALA
jgi:hypothetical protein